MDKQTLKAQVALTMKRLYDRKLTTATGGNTSARFGSIMLITPSGLDKASLTADDIAEVDLETGENLTPQFKLSIESSMHRAIYLADERVNAVCHSHPTTASLFSALSEEIRTDLIAESWYLIPRIVKVPYALMGTKQLAENVAKVVTSCDAMLLENHGALAPGKNLLNAFDKLECLEQAAEMTYKVLGGKVTLSPLSTERMAEIDRVYKC
jgi:Ribulose-5-phosphate 4-epimerase and related epimerases and aldolases